MRRTEAEKQNAVQSHEVMKKLHIYFMVWWADRVDPSFCFARERQLWPHQRQHLLPIANGRLLVRSKHEFATLFSCLSRNSTLHVWFAFFSAPAFYLSLSGSF